MDERRKAIYEKYLHKISPMAIECENLTNQFPLGVFNEVRAIFFHLSKYELLESQEDKKRELSKAEGHLTRAMRDGYKYLCVAYEDIYKDFRGVFKDLVGDALDDEQTAIIRQICSTHAKAVESLTCARTLEIQIDSSERDDEIFKAYETAKERYIEMNSLIEKFYEV